jgi:coiled-coil and C2 domain-containing protein 2A
MYCLGIDDEGVYQLELDLTSLHFTHHPLFSVEHVLASRLQQACRQHATKLASKTIEYHNERVCITMSYINTCTLEKFYFP